MYKTRQTFLVLRALCYWKFWSSNGKAPTDDKVNKVMFALSLITVEQSESFFLPLLSWVETPRSSWTDSGDRASSSFDPRYLHSNQKKWRIKSFHSSGKALSVGKMLPELTAGKGASDQGFFKKEDQNKSVRRSIGCVAFSHQCDTGYAIHLHMLKKSAQTDLRRGRRLSVLRRLSEEVKSAIRDNFHGPERDEV